jgi:hypothetical protein
VMRLTSIEGSFVDLRIVGYRFPDVFGDGTGPHRRLRRPQGN